MYYNPETKEQKDILDLSREFNASFPKDIEIIRDIWYLLHVQTPPTLTPEKEVRNGGIKLIDGKYWQTYKLVKLSPETVCERLEMNFTQLVTDRLNLFASAKGYENITTACTYASSTVSTYKAEGEKAVTSRDSTWSVFYDEMNAAFEAYKEGSRGVPSWEEIEEKLPELSWN